jgi:hypothetical protein
MPTHYIEIAASIFGFCGGSVLSLDALCAVRRVRQEMGKDATLHAVEAAGGTYVDKHGNPLTSAFLLRRWFAGRSVLWARIGFSLMTAGFFLDLLAKLR